MESPASNKNGTRAALIGVGIIIAVCCACALIAGALGAVAYDRAKQTIETAIPDFPFDPGTPTLEPTLTRPPVEKVTTDTLNTLKNTIVPENDLYELACRLQGICNVPTTLPAPAVPFKEGDKQTFWVSNSNTDENFQVETTLMYITPHTYFWAEDPKSVNMDDLKRLMDTFENKIYSTDRAFFGSEWIPGVDNDPRIYVLYVSNIGSSIAGYYSVFDEYNPSVRKYSNGHELFVIGSSQSLSGSYTYSTLAHEFVHMIQFNSDRNDVSWINEGFADLGAFLNGYDVGGADWLFTTNPDLQLNDWADPNSPEFAPHYGSSFLYLAYFLDRFGENATKALTANPKDDLTSVDDTLTSLNITDPQTGKGITADDVFIDWAAAMFLMNGKVGDGRFTFHNYPGAPKTSPTDTISNCPSSQTSSVHQYGIDYIRVDCAGQYTLHFQGSTAVNLLPQDAHSGKYSFWSNKGNESDMTLTREFDLTNVSSPVTFSYWTWYDIEENWDYLNLEVSTDGQHWEILKTPSGTDSNPQGNAYGWGYTGLSNGWIQEEVDLSAYAGKKIQIRFEYITDPNVYGEGFLLDDVHMDTIGYSEDFENGDGGWVGNGFVRVQNVLPQTYRLALIIQGGETTVQMIEMRPDQTAEIPLNLQPGQTATLVITGTTRFTKSVANYSIEVK